MRNGRQEIILLVEDNEDHIEITVDVFNELGLAQSIMVVRTGEEAIDYLFRKNKFKNPVTSPRPRVILLDMKLPSVSGIDVLKQIKTHPDVNMIPVIIYTTSMNQYDIKKSLELGAIDYIIKPIKCKVLQEKLKRAHYR